MVALDGSKASWGEQVGWGVSLVGSICEALDDEHIGAEQCTICVREVGEDPFGDACGMGTRWKSRRAADIKDCEESSPTSRISRVSHDSSMNHECSFIVAVDDQLLHFGVRAGTKNMGSVVTRGRMSGADGTAAICACAGQCAVGQVAFQGTCSGPEGIDTDLNNLQNGFIQACRGSPHVVAECREGVRGEVSDPCICRIGFRRFCPIGYMGAA